MSEINEGIRRTVALLNEHGFATCDSGDGRTADYTCDRCYGYVVVKEADPKRIYARANKLRALLLSVGVPVTTWAGHDGGEDG